ncbi:transcriptional protein SWT1 isoform X2 [Drosophila gunungcola]|nr:transcriptional protein SWT1 isoform X2 [Drosophila gunungcola]
MSCSNEKSGKLKYSHVLGENEWKQLMGSPRLPNVIRQPAQDRLKRLQTNLKRDVKRPTRRFSTSSQPEIDVPIPVPSRRASFSEAAEAIPSAIPLAKSPPHRTFVGRMRIQGKPPRRLSIINPWEKPMALVDASNRLKAGSSQSAHQRLSQLRTLLQQEQKAKETNNNDVVKANEQGNKKQPGTSASSAIPSAFNSSKAVEVGPEPMEWEEFTEDEPPKQAQDLALKENEFNRIESTEEDDISLIRQAADGEELPAHLQDHMYFVLDTNVLMQNIKFVESLTDVVLPGTVGSVLYIPYVVIKELDKLKGQHQDDRDVKRLVAVRAIRYLNTKFDESLEIQAQSAIEAAQHLIEVDCPDDSIVNCCLQLQQHVPNVMLVTNDQNLRLKANASAIQVSCRSDLMATYPYEFAALGD